MKKIFITQWSNKKRAILFCDLILLWTQLSLLKRGSHAAWQRKYVCILQSLCWSSALKFWHWYVYLKASFWSKLIVLTGDLKVIAIARSFEAFFEGASPPLSSPLSTPPEEHWNAKEDIAHKWLHVKRIKRKSTVAFWQQSSHISIFGPEEPQTTVQLT